MLYNLFEYLNGKIDFPGMGLFKYISFRAISASILSLLIALFVGKKIIKTLTKKQIGETIRELGLEGEQQKKNSPTMGGIIILISFLVPTLLLADLTNVYVILMIITALWLGFVGFIDDYIKVFKKNKQGLSGKFKIIGQVSLGLVVGLTLYFSDQAVIRVPSSQRGSEARPEIVSQQGFSDKITFFKEEKSTKTTIPFFKGNEFDYSWLSPVGGKWEELAGWIIYIAVIIFVVTAVSNSTNLTDGLDGLATGISAIEVATLGVLAYVSGNIIYSNYLNIMYIPYTGELVIVLAAFIGALIGFLWYNSYPAQVFMGDTGSLAIGGIIAVSAIVIKKELLIPIFCGILLAESLSVIIQTSYFKYTRIKYGAGRRVFRMTPLHHHFQKIDGDALIRIPKRIIPEAKIVTRFWIIAILLAVFTLITLKIR
ncbi:MAG TPA: phospho-N-acetylmuramoyl-pentapeptide-transferase [Bacteroidales bacterium]|nr:phospho-N-acetylmuramoyl-pentapeptide-transferase [Bacteroidales bacterium]HRR48984.1 phospho-N-acetylmuramoyl-pentapeptide-transferase [Bacteroidales bacterium]HRT33494.1 phospho-N-acetylmuramoyl-pentapeptide-transferase [Bacteroidales bacterium]HRT83822.1 phospho-N-acetylmuramoyl-pentapeptide-transferase [Bacteroidales bacterium]